MRVTLKIYDMWKGESYIDTGTAEELAKKYHVKKETMIWRATAENKRRSKGNRIVLFPTGEKVTVEKKRIAMTGQKHD